MESMEQQQQPQQPHEDEYPYEEEQQRLGTSGPSGVTRGTMETHKTQESQQGEASQLSAHIGFPQIDTPLRLQPPSTINAPERTDVMSRDAQIRASAFSPSSFSLRAVELAALASEQDEQGAIGDSLEGGRRPGPTPAAVAKLRRMRTLRQQEISVFKSHSEHQAPSRTAMSDFNMLAFSSQRAGRDQMEGLAHLSMGVVLDNVGQYPKALESYRKFLAVCRRTNDVTAEALCLNCMGVDCMFIAWPPGSASLTYDADPAATGPSSSSSPQSNEHQQEEDGGAGNSNVKALLRAVDYHEAHLQLADDGGQCVAHCNLGLCFSLLKDYDSSAAHYQNALKIALDMQSIGGQSLAVGNLGLLAKKQGDSRTAKACFEQHLQLVQTLKNKDAEGNALTELGLLADLEHDYEASLGYYQSAAAIAKDAGQSSTLKRLLANMGRAKGKLGMEQHFKGLAEEAAARAGG